MSFIPKAKLFLPVRRDAGVMDLSSENGSELWQTRRLIPQRVEPGDLMVLWPEVDGLNFDATGGPQWPVKQVFWDSDGIMQLELALMILNPTDAVRDVYQSKLRGGWEVGLSNSKRLFTTGGDFNANMRKGEWRK